MNARRVFFISIAIALFLVLVVTVQTQKSCIKTLIRSAEQSGSASDDSDVLQFGKDGTSNGLEAREIFGFEGHLFKVGTTRKEAIADLGPPLCEWTETVENRYYEEDDSIYNLEYEGLTVSFYEVTHERREFLVRVVVSSHAYQVKWGLGIGCPATRVMEVLGRPSQVESDKLIYEFGILSNYIEFEIPEGEVTQVSWNYPPN